MKTTSSKILPVFAVGAVLICSIIRFFQYVSIMDFETGFYNKGSEPAGNLIYIVLFLSWALFIVLCILGKKKGDAAYSVSSDGMGSHATQFLGVSMLVGAFLVVMNAFGEEALTVKCATFVSAAALLAAGFVLLKNTIPPAYTGAMMVIYAVYVFLRTCNFFMSDLVILNHSDTLITLLAYVFFCAFLASTARFYARLETKHSRMREIITTGAAFIFSAVHVISKLLALAFGGKTVQGMSGINTDIAAAAIITGTFLFVLFFTKKSKDIEFLMEEPDKKKEKEGAEPTEN